MSKYLDIEGLKTLVAKIHEADATLAANIINLLNKVSEIDKRVFENPTTKENLLYYEFDKVIKAEYPVDDTDLVTKKYLDNKVQLILDNQLDTSTITYTVDAHITHFNTMDTCVQGIEKILFLKSDEGYSINDDSITLTCVEEGYITRKFVLPDAEGDCLFIKCIPTGDITLSATSSVKYFSVTYISDSNDIEGVVSDGHVHHFRTTGPDNVLYNTDIEFDVHVGTNDSEANDYTLFDIIVLSNGKHIPWIISGDQYKIDKSNVRGNITIVPIVEYKGESFNVDTNVTSGTFIGAISVRSGDVYTATITLNTGYEFAENNFEITMKDSDNNVVTLTDQDYNYDSVSGLLIIPNVTGDITIKAIQTKINYTVSFYGYENLEITGNATVQHGTTYTCTFTPSTGYEVTKEHIHLTVNDIMIVDDEIDYNSATQTLTITNVTGNINIDAYPTLKSYSITADVTNAEFNGSNTKEHGDIYVATLIPGPYYEILTDDVTVTMGGVTLTDEHYTYDQDSDHLTIDSVTGDVIITINARKLTYGVLSNVVNVTMTDNSIDGTVEAGIATYQATFTVQENHQLTVDDISVVMNMTELELDKDYKYDDDTHTLSITKPVDGNIVINATARMISYNITTNIVRGTYMGPSSKNKGETLYAMLTPNDGYEFLSIDVTMGGTTLVAGTDYTYVVETDYIEIPNVNGNIVIRANAVQNVFTVNYDIGEHITAGASNPDTINYNQTFNATFTLDTMYNIDHLYVIMDNRVVEDSYTQSGQVITINVPNIQSNVYISFASKKSGTIIGTEPIQETDNLLQIDDTKIANGTYILRYADENFEPLEDWDIITTITK